MQYECFVRRLEFSVFFGLRHIQERNGFKEMLQQPCRVNVPANITFAGGDVVKERFYVLLPWIKVGSSANCLNYMYVEMAQAHERLSPRPV